MKKRICRVRFLKLMVLMASAIVIVSSVMCKADDKETLDKFEITRAYIQEWLRTASGEIPLISAKHLHDGVLSNWVDQNKTYQIVSVRKPADYTGIGHIPNSINIYWIDIVTNESLSQLDSQKTLILYCYYGHGSMISATILSLLGYKCYSLDFGMMDWNLDALVKKQWDQVADYEVETAVRLSTKLYDVPYIESKHTDVKGIIRKMTEIYFAGEGSPIIRSVDVNEIIDNWDSNETMYQIIDVRSKREYKTGHVPHAFNIPWSEIAEIGNLRKLDPNKTVIVYSDNGQTGQLATTVLNLLGYKAVNILFGMMDWNKSFVDASKQWDGIADYHVVK